MSAVKRRLFNVLAVVSLMLCVAMAALWARSCFAADEIWYGAADSYIAILSVRGRILLGWTSEATGKRQANRWKFATDRVENFPPVPNGVFGFDYQWRVPTINGVTFVERQATMPYWFPALVAAAPPAWWLLWKRPRPKSTSLSCPICGYDLRATPDRCPECGIVPTR
jgi:hypothetical protein